jgi:beta-fructofuranosidase
VRCQAALALERAQINRKAIVSHTPSSIAVPIRQSAGDPHRPQFHFTAPANWLNDPNGLIQWRGQYHLFYQYNPHGPFHGTIHWGHAVSEDLIRWRDLPVALAPTPGGPDAQGCWSGCAVDNNGVPTLIYTGVFPQAVCVATSSDGLVIWDKYPGNPVIAEPPTEFSAPSGGHFRDPYVWRADGGWYMVIGTKVEGTGGLVLLYRSDDLLHWEYLGPILRGDVALGEPFWTGTMWECPTLLDFGEKQALIISAQATHADFLYPFYVTGVFSPDGFAPEAQGILVHGGPGGDFYAPQVMRLDDGRYVLWGWLKEDRSERACMEASWAGALSLPLTVSLAPDGGLSLAPVHELQALRGRHWHYEDVTLAPEADELLADTGGDCLEIIAQLEPGASAEVGLKVRRSPRDEEYTRVMVQQAQQRIVIKRDHSSLDAEVSRDLCVAPISAAPNESVTLHIFLDRSVMEVFADDGRTNLASRIYPTHPHSLGISLFSRGGPAVVRSLDIWTMNSIW